MTLEEEEEDSSRRLHTSHDSDSNSDDEVLEMEMEARRPNTRGKTAGSLMPPRRPLTWKYCMIWEDVTFHLLITRA